MTDELTHIQKRERDAMVGDSQAVIEVVSALREYRQVVKNLLNARYGDGECDSYSLHELLCVVEEIEVGHEARTEREWRRERERGEELAKHRARVARDCEWLAPEAGKE